MTTSKKRPVARPAATAEQRLRLLDAASRMAVLEMTIAHGDPFDGRNRFVLNERFCEMFGITDSSATDALARLQTSVDPRDREARCGRSW